MAVLLKTRHSMLRRCRGWDYRQPCIYQITLVLADRQSKALGRLVVPDLALPRQAQDSALPRQAQNRPCQAQDRLCQAQNRPRQEQDRLCHAQGGLQLVQGEGENFTRLVLEAAASSYIAITQAGEAVRQEFRRIGEHHPEITPLFIQVMPDHVHFIIYVKRPMARPLGQAIAGFKAGSSKAAIGKPGLWAEGFQDTILFHEGQLEAMFNYLRDNPRRLAVKQLMPMVFRVRNDLILALPRQAQDRALPRQVQNNRPPQAQDRPCQAQGGQPQAQNRPLQTQGGPLQVQGMVQGSVPATEVAGLEAHFSAIGNLFLLDSPNILQVQCSRSWFAYKRLPKPGGGRKIARDAADVPVAEMTTPEFEARRDDLLAAAKHGAVLISPCISDGEREIARLAFAANGAVIALRNMGFSPLYKPGGKLFDKTANGKLLLLAPAAWPYSTREKPMTRFDACAMNRIAQLIAGEGAAMINYKGMKPADIDRLVREAVSKG